MAAAAATLAIATGFGFGVLVIMVVMVMMAPTAASAAMRMVMIVRMSMSATASAFVMVLVGVGQRRSKSALECDGLLARCITAFDRKCHDLCPETEVVDLTEVVPAQTALAIEDQHRRRALDLEGLHRFRQRASVDGIDADRKAQSIFFREIFDGLRVLDFRILKRSVERDHRDLVVGKGVRQALRLRQTVLDATRAVQLERRHHDDLPLEGLERQRAIGIDPSSCLEFRRVFGIEHEATSLSLKDGNSARILRLSSRSREAAPAGERKRRSDQAPRSRADYAGRRY